MAKKMQKKEHKLHKMEEKLHRGEEKSADKAISKAKKDKKVHASIEKLHRKEEKMSKDHEHKSPKGGKVKKVMEEFKAGKLHSGSKKGPEVTNPKQAIAIGLSEARKKGEKVKARK